MDWFYTENLVLGMIPLAAEEARHAAGAKRLGVNDAIILFDGRGKIATATLAEITKKSVIANVSEIRAVAPPARHVEIAVAVPKSKRWQFLVEKLTELGATRIIPLRFTRSVVVDSERENAHRWAREAAKQARRAWLPEISEQVTLNAWLAATAISGAEFAANKRLFVALPTGKNYREYAADFATNMPDIAGIIGPEGGFTAAEIALIDAASAQPLKLSANILRVETAALALAALFVN